MTIANIHSLPLLNEINNEFCKEIDPDPIASPLLQEIDRQIDPEYFFEVVQEKKQKILKYYGTDLLRELLPTLAKLNYKQKMCSAILLLNNGPHIPLCKNGPSCFYAHNISTINAYQEALATIFQATIQRPTSVPPSIPIPTANPITRAQSAPPLSPELSGFKLDLDQKQIAKSSLSFLDFEDDLKQPARK